MGLVGALKTQEHTWQQCGPWSSSFLGSLDLVLLFADHSTGNLFEIFPGYVAYVALNNAFGIILWYGTVIG